MFIDDLDHGFDRVVGFGMVHTLVGNRNADEIVSGRGRAVDGHAILEPLVRYIAAQGAIRHDVTGDIVALFAQAGSAGFRRIAYVLHMRA